MRTSFRHSFSATLALALAAAQIGLAQEVTKLNPVTQPNYTGVRVATAQGYADAKGHSYSVEDLALSQRIIVFVSESNFGRRVRVELAKFDDFLEPLRTCQTTPTKDCVIRTRTDGDLFIRVKSIDQAHAEYIVVVWAGAQSKAELPSLFTPSRGAVADKTGFPATSVPPTNPSDGAEQMTAKFFAYDASRQVLVVKDAVGTTFEFVLPSEAKLAVSGKDVRVAEYLKAHFNNLPYASDQQLRIGWKPSTSGKGRVIVAVR